MLTSCGKKSDDNDDGSPSFGLNQDDLGYSPGQRWDDTGNYSYNYSLTINGVNCKTNQVFKNKADYCMGLQDQALNKDCALELRKRSYANDCGDDFQEVNFKNKFLDMHLTGPEGLIYCFWDGIPKKPS